MEVVFCVKDSNRKYRVAAYATLDIPEGDLDQYVGQTLPFTIRREFGDVGPFVEYLPRGIMRKTAGGDKFYGFEVVSGRGNSGQLVVLTASSEKGCLPADAPQ